MKTKDVYIKSIFAAIMLQLTLVCSCVEPQEYWPDVIDFDDLSPAEMNEDLIREMEYFINSGRFSQVNSILVIKDGKNVFERYYNGADSETLQRMLTQLRAGVFNKTPVRCAPACAAVVQKLVDRGRVDSKPAQQPQDVVPLC